MANHRDTHPVDVEGCFGCKALGVSVATLRIRHGADPVERVPVVREEGRLAGTVGGYHAKHWDGRQDATVCPPTVALKTRVSELA